MSHVEPKSIVTVSLRYHSTAGPLRTLAFAELAAKVLYVSGAAINDSHVRKGIASVIGIRKVSISEVKGGLGYLKDNGVAKVIGEMWSLTDKATEEIEKNVRITAESRENVLSTHFPEAIERDVLREWFSEASSVVFGRFGDTWIATVSKGTTRQMWEMSTLQELILPSIRQYSLEAHTHSLVEGYRHFLESDQERDQKYLMNIGQAMFSARLVAADVGVDPFTIEEFRSATMLLDTNVLFAIALERHRVTQSLLALAKALKTIHVEVGYLGLTREEYLRVVEGKRGAIRGLRRLYSEEVLRGARDDFLATALARACRTDDDFERFFDSLHDLPAELGKDLEIRKIDDDITEKAIRTAEEDNKLKNNIQSSNLKAGVPGRRHPKGEASLNHDASLIHAVEAARARGDRCWVASLDRTLQACASRRAGPYDPTTVVSIDALIEILAAQTGGPEFDASDFAPLLARIIANQCEPAPDTYTTEDLQWLAAINEEATTLSPRATQEIARAVSKARIEGAKKEDRKLQLKVNRMFQAKKTDAQRDQADLLARAKGAETGLEQETSKRIKREEQLVGMEKSRLTREENRKFVLDLTWRSIVSLGVPAAIWVAAPIFVKQWSTTNVVFYIVFTAGPLILGAVRLIPTALRTHKKRIERVEDKAREVIVDFKTK